MWPTREDRLRLSLSLFLFRFACASRGGIGGVVERKAEIDFHGRVARSLPALLIGNCVPAIDKTAECESWEYVERSFHGFVCVFTGEIREKGGEFEEGGIGVADFRRKIYIYRYEMKTVLYISGMEDPVMCSLIILTIFLKE